MEESIHQTVYDFQCFAAENLKRIHKEADVSERSLSVNKDINQSRCVELNYSIRTPYCSSTRRLSQMFITKGILLKHNICRQVFHILDLFVYHGPRCVKAFRKILLVYSKTQLVTLST